MPEPIPEKVMRLIKYEKGLTSTESKWLAWAIVVSALALAATCLFLTPMPLMFAFAFDAVTFARMECEI